MAKTKTAKTSKNTILTGMPKFVVKDNRIIPIYPGFTVISGSEENGSILLIKDPVSGDKYRYIERKVALSIIDKVLTLLKQKFDAGDESFADSIAMVTKERETMSSARAIYQKICSKPVENMPHVSLGSVLEGKDFLCVHF